MYQHPLQRLLQHQKNRLIKPAHDATREAFRQRLEKRRSNRTEGGIEEQRMKLMDVRFPKSKPLTALTAFAIANPVNRII
jgi:hypothetical protein